MRLRRALRCAHTDLVVCGIQDRRRQLAAQHLEQLRLKHGLDATLTPKIFTRRGVQLGELLGELRVITTGLNREDRVVTGDLWRAAPGSKVVPQLTTITPPPGSPLSGTPAAPRP